jgi:hypothetical protein
LSSRNQLAALRCAEAASLGDGGRENEHEATLERKSQGVKPRPQASDGLCMAQPRLRHHNRSYNQIILTKTIRWKDWFWNGIPPAYSPGELHCLPSPTSQTIFRKA